jgi:hypothetical protein
VYVDLGGGGGSIFNESLTFALDGTLSHVQQLTVSEALAMAIGPIGLAQRALVPVQLQPAERVQDLLDILRGGALAVGVLDPHKKLTVASLGIQIVE